MVGTMHKMVNLILNSASNMIPIDIEIIHTILYNSHNIIS